MSKKLLSLLLASALLLVAASGALAAETDHWADASIERCTELGILQGMTASQADLDLKLPRGEMFKLMDNVMRYQHKGEDTFTDLESGYVHYDAILKLVQAGVVTGYEDSTVAALSPITREEAIVLFARMFRLDENASAAASFGDSASIGEWAKPLVGAMKQAGFVQGWGGNLHAKENVTLGEVTTILSNMLGALINTAGTYETDTGRGFTVVNAGGVTLKELTVGGNLLIAPGVGEGTVTLDTISINGSLDLMGGGKNSIIIKGDFTANAINIFKDGDTLRLVNETGETLPAVYVDDGSSAIVLEGAFGNLNIGGGVAVTLDKATVASVSIEGDQTTLTVNSNSEANAVTVAGDEVKLEGSGTVETVKVAEGEGVSVSIPGATVEVSENAGAVKVGTATVQPGESTEVPTTPSGGSVSGGGGFTGSSKVDLEAESKGTAGDKKITELTKDTYYYVRQGGASSNTYRGVKADGTLGTIADMEPLTGTEIKGLVNGTTYKVMEATAVDKTKVSGIVHWDDSVSVEQDYTFEDGVFKILLPSDASKALTLLGLCIEFDEDKLGIDEETGSVKDSKLAAARKIDTSAAQPLLAYYLVESAQDSKWHKFGDANGTEYLSSVITKNDAPPAAWYFTAEKSDPSGQEKGKLVVYTGNKEADYFFAFLLQDGSLQYLDLAIEGRVELDDSSISGLTAGHKEIKGLTSGNCYYVEVGDESPVRRYVTAAGKLSANLHDMRPLGTGVTKITGLENGETYKVTKAEAVAEEDILSLVHWKENETAEPEAGIPFDDLDDVSYAGGVLTINEPTDEEDGKIVEQYALCFDFDAEEQLGISDAGSVAGSKFRYARTRVGNAGATLESYYLKSAAESKWVKFGDAAGTEVAHANITDAVAWYFTAAQTPDIEEAGTLTVYVDKDEHDRFLAFHYHDGTVGYLTVKVIEGGTP